MISRSNLWAPPLPKVKGCDIMKSNETNTETIIRNLLEKHCPKKHRLFKLIENAKLDSERFGRVFDELYTRYQAAMHATRVMVYFLPHLDTINLRIRKCAIIAEDDNLPEGDSHHTQLRRTWTKLLGREPKAKDSFFGSLDRLAENLDPGTARFVSHVHREYPKTLGPWIVIEGLAHNWIVALCKALSRHFPDIQRTEYFVGNLTSGVELEHATASLDLFFEVLRLNPQIETESIEAVESTAAELDRFWEGCCQLFEC